MKLYERVSKVYNGIVGCAYITDKSAEEEDSGEGGGGICQITSLCEVIKCQKSPSLDGQPPSLFLEVRCVSRARIRACVEALEEKGGAGEGWMVGVVEEVFDDVPPNLELPWVVVDGIEDKIRNIAVAEEKVKISGEAKGEHGGEKGESKKEIGRIEKRVTEAQQMEFNMNNQNDYVPMENEEEFMEENELLDCFDGAKKASTEVANMYGSYVGEEGKRTVQELVGTSWGAFKIPGVSYVDRIRALDCDDVFERLKMANYMLMNREKLLQAKLALSKIKAPGDEIQSVGDLPGDDDGVEEGEGGA